VIADVRIGDRVRRVEATRTAGTWRVTLDGRALEIDAVRAGQWWSVLFAGSLSHEVAVDDRGHGDLVVHVDGTAVPVTLIDPRAAWARRGRDHGAHGAGPAHIVAPMPGRVVKLLVAAGDQVAARQGVVVVEAMKMENELRAPRDGRVAEVRVVEGASVDANAVLVVIE
jgi:biotin carboxyl carrier protein